MECGRADLIDAVYEAAVVPELWPDLLGNISIPAEAAGGALITLPAYVHPLEPKIIPKVRWTASERVAPMFSAFFAEGWISRCDWVRRARALSHPFFVHDGDLFEDGEFETKPSYQFYRRFGLGWCAGLFMSLPSGDLFTVAFERLHEKGPVPQRVVAFLNELRPHLARAATIAARLGLERARAATAALSILGLPAAVLCPLHRIIDANEQMAALMPSVIVQAGRGRLHLVDRQADALFGASLARVAAGTEAMSEVLSLPMPGKEDHPPAVLHILPIRRSARDLFSAASCMVVVTPLVGRDLPAANVIQGLFDLTATEARITRLVASGQTIAQAAAVSGSSEGTVRTHLKSIFAKTGVSRQAELVSLLGVTALGPLREVGTDA